jgi:hypothetical protein
MKYDSSVVCCFVAFLFACVFLVFVQLQNNEIRFMGGFEVEDKGRITCNQAKNKASVLIDFENSPSSRPISFSFRTNFERNSNNFPRFSLQIETLRN